MVLCHRLLRLLLQFQQKVVSYVGKTQILYNLGCYMALQHRRVLFVDLDYQANLTSFFSKLSDSQIEDHSIYNAFVHDAHSARSKFDLDPIKISKYVSILPADSRIMDVDRLMTNRPSLSSYVLLHYITAEKFKDQYDYVLIDNHNSYGLSTFNALVCADWALMPITPSIFSINGIGLSYKLFNCLKDRATNPLTGKSFITCKIKMIANRVKANTRVSNDLRKQVNIDRHFITLIEDRELFTHSSFAHQSIFDYARDKAVSASKADHRDLAIVKNRLEPAFRKIYETISK